MATKNEVRKVGRPAAVLTFPRGAFTVSELSALNPDVCTLTVRNKIKEGLASNFLVKCDKSEVTGEAGRPAHRFMRAAVANANRKNRQKAAAPVSAPTVTVEVEAVTPEAVPADPVAPVAVEAAVTA